MTKCVFCGKEENYFFGVNLIKNDGNVDFYCSSKCRKNALKLGRDKKRIKWTEAYKLELIKEKKDAERLKEREKKYVEDKKIDEETKVAKKEARKKFEAKRDSKESKVKKEEKK